ncbi:hypothetical protein OQA88_12740 [Cercophora sp. LCS_1]
MASEPPTLMGLMMSTSDLPATLPPPNRPASTWHSEADTTSTAVDTPAVVVTAIDAEVPTPTTPKANAKRDIKEEFIQVSPAVSSEDELSAAGSPRGRLGHIVSIEGIKRSLSQGDLRVRKGSRIRSAMSKLSGRWKKDGGAVGVGGEEKK